MKGRAKAFINWEEGWYMRESVHVFNYHTGSSVKYVRRMLVFEEFHVRINGWPLYENYHTYSPCYVVW